MIKRMLAVGFVVASMVSAVCIPASAAGNYKDTLWTVEAINNSGGTPYSSAWRTKADSSSAWCENKTTSGGSLKVWVNCKNNKSSKVDRYYGSMSYNGATKNTRTLQKGEGCYLPNYVKEDGYNYAGIGFVMNRENVKYTFAWSPDSI